MLVPEDILPKLVANNAPLEIFPDEIEHHFLFKLDLEGLKALTFASPIYFLQYLFDRDHLLCKCLETTLGSVAVDACTVYQSGLVDFLITRTPKSVSQFLQSYKDHFSLSPFYP